MPPASANDNQGLKIAVGLLSALSVILAVSTYLGFAENAKTGEKLVAADKSASDAKANEGRVQSQYSDLRERVGVAKIDESAVTDELKKQMDALTQAVQAIPAQAQNIVAKAQGPAGGGNAQTALDELNTAADSFASEPNKTLLASLTRMSDLMQKISNLSTEIAVSAEGTRKELEAANQVGAAKTKVETDAKEVALADLMAELQKHEEDRKSLIGRNDDLQARNQQQANEINQLKSQYAQLEEDSKTKQSNLLVMVRQQRELLEKDITHLESANGYVKYVDHNRDEVFTTLSSRAGAREQMIFSVFDRNATGIAADKPKATVQLVRVDQNGSIGRITKRFGDLSPIQIGDQLYSPSFDAQPRTYALIGKIDMDQNGSDDREDLKRLIRSSGGEIVYDLPPPGVGVEQGKLTALTSWYVLDDEPPLRPGTERDYGATAEEIREFDTKKTQALSEARASGVQPINLSKLKRMLNFQLGAPRTGMVEGADRKAIENLIHPQGRSVPVPDASATPPDTEATPETNPGR